MWGYMIISIICLQQTIQHYLCTFGTKMYGFVPPLCSRDVQSTLFKYEGPSPVPNYLLFICAYNNLQKNIIYK